jgi:flagellar basal-body rod modification protein FlgD
MSTTQATSGVAGQQGQQATTGSNSFNSLDVESFIKMLVAELQNQDPMNPTSNSEILQEVSQIKAIQSNQQLNETLQSVELGQNLASAANLLNQTIKGLDDSGNTVSGKVDKISIDNNVPTLHIGNSTVALKNVSEILPAGTAAPAQDAAQQ